MARLLAEAGLPLEGALEAVREGVVLAEGRQLVGCAGLERWGELGLLRSVAVAAERRGQGLGTALVAAAEARAAAAGIRELYLLTETAAPFFGRLGYLAVPRAELPGAVAASPEAGRLCPESAVAMRRRLG
ncbi:MAG TPA: arsenic resistance N-acetyltransferase ArsN2 [Candidatus Limnocylindrales bacterium]